MSEFDESWQDPRDPDETVFNVPGVIFKGECQTETEVVQVGERVCGIDGNRNDDRVDLFKKDLFYLRLFFNIQGIITFNINSW